MRDRQPTSHAGMPSLINACHLSGPSRFCESTRDLLKEAPLLVPVDPADNGPKVSLVKALDEWQKQDLFLYVRSQVEQPHDLCHTGSAHPAQARQFRIVPNRLIPQLPFKPDSERHEARYPGNRAARRFATGRLTIG